MDLHALPKPFSGSAAETALNRLIAAIEDAFPDRVRGYYVHGRAADDTNIESSDIDVDVVVKGAFTDAEERARLAAVVQRASPHTHIEMDVDVIDEATLFTGAAPSFKLGSRLVYGEDIREQVPLLPIADWGRERMYAGYWLMMKVFNRPGRVQIPIGFPDPDGEFLGYTERKVVLADGSSTGSTRDLVRVTGWLATALLAHEAGQYVVRKRECHRLYRDHFHDEWGSLLEAIYVSCRLRWAYMIPTEPDDRRDLRVVCTRVLAFENHFLTRFKPFLLDELVRARLDEANRAIDIMREIPLEDEEVSAALKSVSD